MHICNRCQARHEVLPSKCSVCGFKKYTEWKAAASREGVVAISSPPSPKDIARLKIGWKNTVKSIENAELAPRPGRWLAFYIPTSYTPEGEEVNGKGFRVTLTIKLLSKGKLRYHGKYLTNVFDEITEFSLPLSKLHHGWHYAQVTGSGSDANHTIVVELHERAYSRYLASTKSKPLVPWTFWYFPHSMATLPVAFLSSELQEAGVAEVLNPIKEQYAKQIEALKLKRVKDEETADNELRSSFDERLGKAFAEIPTDEYYDTKANTAKENKRQEVLAKLKKREGAENYEALKKEAEEYYTNFRKNVDSQLAAYKEEAAEKRAGIRNNLRNEYRAELSRIRAKLDLDLRNAIERLKLDEERELREKKSELINKDLMTPLVTFSKHFAAGGPLQDRGRALTWEAEPENGHYGDSAGWTGHCDAAGFASALFEEPVDKGIWKGEELKFIVSEYVMSFILKAGNSSATWKLGDTDSRTDISHVNFIGHFRGNLNSPHEYARSRANELKTAAGKNGANLLEKLQTALFKGLPIVMDMRVNRNFSDEALAEDSKQVWNHCVFCYEVHYREAADATGGAAEMARDLVAHITIYANKDLAPPTTRKAATVNATDPPDITLLPENCIIRHCAVRLQFGADGKIDITSVKADWLGCHAKRSQKDDLDFEYTVPRLPPRYVTVMLALTPASPAMANPFITQNHIKALVEGDYLKWSRTKF
jgi:hypothetical protein